MIVLSLGSNIGAREKYLYSALQLLAEKVRIVRSSSVLETKPVGYTQQHDFLNMVVVVETVLSPRELLQLCKEIEVKLGRQPTFRYGPRTIDLDILLYDDLKISEEDLTIPHPRMQEREFIQTLLKEVK